VKIAVTEAEAENMNNDEESDSDKAKSILGELNAKMDQLRSLNIQIADFEKVWRNFDYILYWISICGRDLKILKHVVIVAEC